MGVKFTRESAVRIAKVVQKVEGRAQSGTSTRGAFGSVQFDYMLCGKTLATSVKNSEADIMLYAGSTSAGLTATGQQIKAYNRFGTIQANRWVFVWTLPWGLEISAAEC